MSRPLIVARRMVGSAKSRDKSWNRLSRGSDAGSVMHKCTDLNKIQAWKHHVAGGVWRCEL